MKRIFVFPGQGSQAVGMGKELAENFSTAKEVFAEVDNALSQDLSKIIFEGPIEDLTLTVNTQPALMAVSMALIRVMEKEFNLHLSKIATVVAGHSLGEYTALAAAGSLSISQTAKLLKIRGNAMQEAVPVGVGAMAALLGVDTAEANEISNLAKEGDVCQVANDNSVGQIVISGNLAAIDRAIAIAVERGKRAVKLPVSAPFHSALMLPAQEVMAENLKNAEIKKPVVPIICNVTALETSDVETIRQNLITQVSGMVRWRETIEHLTVLGIGETVEIGAGKVLTSLTKRINKELGTFSIQNIKEIEEFAANFS